MGGIRQAADGFAGTMNVPSGNLMLLPLALERWRN